MLIMTIMGMLRVAAAVTDDADAVVVMVMITLRQKHVKTVAKQRNAGIRRQQNVTQKSVTLGPHISWGHLSQAERSLLF
jgi:hypothetical protein